MREDEEWRKEAAERERQLAECERQIAERGRLDGEPYQRRAASKDELCGTDVQQHRKANAWVHLLAFVGVLWLFYVFTKAGYRGVGAVLLFLFTLLRMFHDQRDRRKRIEAQIPGSAGHPRSPVPGSPEVSASHPPDPP